MKKILFLIPILVLCSCVDKEQIKKEIKEDFKKELVTSLDSMQMHIKGDGSNFYNEYVKVGSFEYDVHHSTLDCPRIQNGVTRNCYKNDYYSNTFCSFCMDDELIDKWTKWFFPKKAK